MTTTDTRAAQVDDVLGKLFATPEGMADPYPLLAGLRPLGDRLPTTFGTTALIGYDDALQLLRHPDFGRGDMQLGSMGGADPELVRRFVAHLQDSMIFVDPPEHTRLRSVMTRVFTPRRVEALRPAVEAMTDELLDTVAAGEDLDVMDRLALPLPLRVIGELLGVPEGDRLSFRDPVRLLTLALEPFCPTEGYVEATRGVESMKDYLRDLVADFRRTPREGLLSALIQAQDGPASLSDEEVVATALVLFSAGFETTTNLIGNGLRLLADHPDQAALLHESPARSKTAVEEILRFESPVQINGRQALADTELFGEKVAAGSQFLVLVGATNRDPAKFEDAERFDVTRDGPGPLSFGYGIHLCIGASLARMEGEVFLRKAFERFGGVELAGEPERRLQLTIRGYGALPLRFTR